MSLYKLEEIPRDGKHQIIEVEAVDLAEIRRKALELLGQSKKRYIITLDGKNLGEAFKVSLFRCDRDPTDECFSYLKCVIKEFDHYGWLDRGWFLTEKEAKDDYAENEKKADVILDRQEKELKNFLLDKGINLSYCLKGDTYGIYEDYQYISVNLNGYIFIRII